MFSLDISDLSNVAAALASPFRARYNSIYLFIFASHSGSSFVKPALGRCLLNLVTPDQSIFPAERVEG